MAAKDMTITLEMYYRYRARGVCVTAAPLDRNALCTPAGHFAGFDTSGSVLGLGQWRYFSVH